MASPVDKARELENEARSKRRAAMLTLNDERKLDLMQKSAKLYVEAGNYWMRELTASKGYPRKMDYARQNAHQDYTMGRSITSEIKEGRLERRAIASIAIISLIGALASISMNITGNAIGGSLDNNNWISIGLFFLGCVLTLFYFKAKNRNVKAKNKKK